MGTNLQIQRGNLRRLIDILHTYSTIVAQVLLHYCDIKNGILKARYSLCIRVTTGLKT